MKLSVSTSLKENFYGWVLIFPFVVSLLVFFLFALVRTVGYSFTEYDLFTSPNWNGLSNYISLFSDPLFFRAAVNTFSFSLIVTAIQTFLALILAVVVNSEIRGKGFFRTVYYIPSIMSSAAITLIFIWVYQKNGFLNSLISTLSNHAIYILLFLLAAAISQITFVLIQRKKIGRVHLFDSVYAILSLIVAWAVVSIIDATIGIDIGNQTIENNWLGTREMVGPMPLTLWAIVLQNIFTTVPTLMLLFLAGLQSIPKDLYESAQIDGANKWQQLIHITVPQLAPVTFVVITMGIIGTLQMFDQVALLGGGVPLESRITLAYYVYHYAFPDGSSPKIGIASAAALILGLITLVMVGIQKRFGVKEHSDG